MTSLLLGTGMPEGFYYVLVLRADVVLIAVSVSLSVLELAPWTGAS